MTIQISGKSYNQGFKGFILTKKQILFLLQVHQFLPRPLGPKNDPSDVYLHGRNNLLSDSTSKEKSHIVFIWLYEEHTKRKLIIRMFRDKGNYYLHFRLLGFQHCQNSELLFSGWWWSKFKSYRLHPLSHTPPQKKNILGKVSVHVFRWKNGKTPIQLGLKIRVILSHWTSDREELCQDQFSMCSPPFHLRVETDPVPKKLYFFLEYEKIDKFRILVILKVIYCNWEPSRIDG